MTVTQQISASERREIFEAGAKWWFCEVNPGRGAGYWFTRQSKAQAALRYPDTPAQPKPEPQMITVRVCDDCDCRYETPKEDKRGGITYMVCPSCNSRYYALEQIEKPTPAQPYTTAEGAVVFLLRRAGCKCPSPLIGMRPDVGPRCRLCNVVYEAQPPRPGVTREQVESVIYAHLESDSDSTYRAGIVDAIMALLAGDAARQGGEHREQSLQRSIDVLSLKHLAAGGENAE